jgi:zinc and cadmium transporter
MEAHRHVIFLLSVYSLAIVIGSLIGGSLPRFIRMTHTRIQLSISFVGGLMVGVAVFHLLPHSLHALGSERIDEAALAMMLGLLIMFFMLRFFHFHQHESVDLLSEEAGGSNDHAHDHPPHDAQHAHGCEVHHPHAHQHAFPLTLTWAGVLLGLGVHTMMDGVALASAVQAEAHHAETSSFFWGAGVFLAVLLHKPLDAMSISALMRAQGASSSKILGAIIAFSLMVPVGAFCLVFFGSRGGYIGNSIAAWGLAFSAGVFLCIALSDLLPEMEFHSHHKIPLSIALLGGVCLAWCIGFIEPSHLHEHHDHPTESIGSHIHDHDHDHGHRHEGDPQHSHKE